MQILSNIGFRPLQSFSQNSVSQQPSESNLESKDSIQFSAKLKPEMARRPKALRPIKAERKEAMKARVQNSLEELSKKYGYQPKEGATVNAQVHRLREKIKKDELRRANILNRVALEKDEDRLHKLEDREAALLEQIGDFRTHRFLMEQAYGIKDTERAPTFNSIHGLRMDYEALKAKSV